jgi:DnaJ-domain-containing protein 1
VLPVAVPRLHVTRWKFPKKDGSFSLWVGVKADHFRPSFVAGLKAHIPKAYRRWIATLETWLVSEKYERMLKDFWLLTTDGDRCGCWKTGSCGVWEQQHVDSVGMGYGCMESKWRPTPPPPPPRRPPPPPRRVRTKLEIACALLGVSVYAKTAEIKRASHRMALEHHPDRGGSHEKMVEINLATEYLLGRL